MHRSFVLVAGATVALLVALIPGQANACGCFVDSDSTVDQEAERILYIMEDDELTGETTTTAIIQIQYEGGREDFGWILPVPALPEEVTVHDGTVFNDLDLATAPQLYASAPSSGGPFFGCGAARASSAESFDSGVDIWGGGEIGPFEYVILTGDTSADVFNWMNLNGYVAPTNTGAILDEYIADGFYFVVLKLLPGASADVIQPIGVRYKGDMPCVPLKLTGLGAVETWVCCCSWWVPSATGPPTSPSSPSPRTPCGPARPVPTIWIGSPRKRIWPVAGRSLPSMRPLSAT